MFAALHRLVPGDELDYRPLDNCWLPARVEQVSNDGSLLSVRFSCGAADLLHTLDLKYEEDLKRVAAAGTRTCPVLDRLAVDFLIRTDRTATFPASQQWQKGEPCGERMPSRGNGGIS